MKEILLGNNLVSIETQIWLLLEQAVRLSQNAFHQGYVSTINNHFPEQRTVVLRSIDTTKKILSFHTDIRSEKIAHLKANNALSWLFYDNELKLQLRIYSKATIHTGGVIADIAWGKSRLASQMCYTTQEKSGSIVVEPKMIDVNRKNIEPELLLFARKNFCVIETNALAMDFVFLNAKGNKRGFFDYLNNNFYWRQV